MSASVLETFLILFETNADDVKEGTKQARKATAELDKDLNATDQMAQKVGQSFSGATKAALGALAAFASIGAVITGVTLAARENDALGKFAESVNASIEDIDAWGQATTRAGGDAAGFRGSVLGLTEKLQDLAVKGENELSPVLRMIGVEARDMSGRLKQPIPLLLELASAFEKMPKETSKGLGSKLGLDQGTVMLLQRGRRAVEELVERQKMLGVTTKEDAELAAKFNMQLDDLGQVLRSLFTGIGSAVLPWLTEFGKLIEKAVIYLRDHKDAVMGFFIGVAAAVTAFFLPAMLKAAAATLAATWPFLLIAGAITAMGVAFALVYEDIMAFRAGHASLIGDIFDKWPMVAELAKLIGGAITWVFDTIQAVWLLIGDLFVRPTEAFQNFMDRLDAGKDKFMSVLPSVLLLTEGVSGAFTAMGDVVVRVWEAIKAVIMSVLDGIGSRISAVVDRVASVKSWFGFGADDPTGDSLRRGNEQIGQAAANPLTAQTSNSIVNAQRTEQKSSSVRIDKVEVNTQATDAEGVARDIGTSLNSQMSSALNAFDDGVAR